MGSSCLGPTEEHRLRMFENKVLGEYLGVRSMSEETEENFIIQVNIHTLLCSYGAFNIKVMVGACSMHERDN
jgi:hypothetical protein